MQVHGIQQYSSSNQGVLILHMNYQKALHILVNLYFHGMKTDENQQMLPFVMKIRLNDHQNITYDHSCYSITLFDGYFLTGMGEEDITS